MAWSGGSGQARAQGGPPRHGPAPRVGRRRALTTLTLAIVALGGALAPLPAAAGTDTDHDGLPDAWEERWGVTDPLRADSDGDGVRDSAEDPDGDDLSNRAERRYGTSPKDSDTDGNGTPDGREDSDGDGRSDAAEQDDRPVPSGLIPSLADAPSDLPINYADGCHHTVTETTFHPCIYGDRHGATRLVLFGDSRVAQWLPAVIKLAKPRHWRIGVVTKAACPSVSVATFSKYGHGALPACARFRKRALAWIAGQAPDVVLISNYGGYVVLDAHGHAVPADEREATWGAGLKGTLTALPDAATAVVLADTPRMLVDPTRCLPAHLKRISACVTPRSKAIFKSFVAAERAAALARGATFASLSAAVCPYDPCPVIVDDLLLWRDSGHLTATYARQLRPALGTILDAAVPTGSVGPPAMMNDIEPPPPSTAPVSP